MGSPLMEYGGTSLKPEVHGYPDNLDNNEILEQPDNQAIGWTHIHRRSSW